MGRARGTGRPAAEGAFLTDILAGQPADASRLAEIYDLEHDEIEEDHAFYREWVRRAPGAVVDLGCGSGRLFEAFLTGGANRVVGIDGSRALLARAEARIAAHPSLREAHAVGRIELMEGDVRVVRRSDRFALAVLAGVLSHLDGPEDALRTLVAARRIIEPGGTAIVDQLGPGDLPPHDLPLSVDWERERGGERIIRRSELERRELPEGLRVRYRTVTDVIGADGTISRLPASFRLWYPSAATLRALVEEAELDVAGMYGSHDLEPFDDNSDRCIVVARRRGG